MALSKNIPLKNLIFDEKTLTQILELLSKDFKDGAPRDSYQRYSLDISEDSETLISVNQPPETISAFLENPVHQIRLRFEISNPSKKDIEFKIENGADRDFNNYVKISGEDEGWVHDMHRNVKKILNKLDGHTSFFRVFEFGIGFVLILFIAFILYRLEWLVFSWVWTSKIPDKGMGFGFLMGVIMIIPLIISVISGLMLADFFKKAYPSIEIRTGGVKQRMAERRRKLIKPIFVFLILTPILTYLEDLWKMFLIGK